MQAQQRQCDALMVYLALALVLAILFLVSFILVWRKNQALKRTNDMLYRQTMRNHDAVVPVPAATPASEPGPEGGNDEAADQDHELMERITQALTQDGAVFKPDFCAQRLSDMVGINYKYISHAINSATGSNFNALPSEFRSAAARDRG